jgi:hypothetical protein
VRLENQSSCARESCQHCGEVVSKEHVWVLVDSETDYEESVLPGRPNERGPVKSDTTVYKYKCHYCPETREESVRSEWV